jgi:hypothetical protein
MGWRKYKTVGKDEQTQAAPSLPAFKYLVRDFIRFLADNF